MKKLILALVFLPFLSFCQIAEFETNYIIGNGVTTEFKMKWSIYETKAVGEMTDKKIIKIMQESKTPTTQVFELKSFGNNNEAKFTKDINGNYVYQTENVRFLVTNGQLVKLSTKDDFTGQVSEIAYVYVK